ncbi:MAG: sigma-54-dependent Fis family transcriptional regulator [Polyangiaceae bacterium]|nr:sigma-54-dependent Fis family transcriptional regulator [Polyangiaceae bacterium]
MRALFQELGAAAELDRPLLIEGEPGTGKKALGRLVHQQSPRANRPLVIVGCGAVAVDLIDAELFGEAEASGERHGALQRAERGTLLLDEVIQLPLRAQEKLGATLQSFERDGAWPVRVIATSDRPMSEEVQRGRVDPTLYGQFSGFTFTLPPLRNRPEDIEVLAQHFLELATRNQPAGLVPELTPRTLRSMTAHDWPGNARELRNVVERAVQRTTATTPPSRTLDVPLLEPTPAPPASFDETLSYRETRARLEAEFERSYVTWLLERHRGNISAASREARMDRKYLYDLARRHGLRAVRGER